MTTTRAAILSEIETRLKATGRAFDRNPGVPGDAPSTGKIFMADGDPGSPVETIGERYFTYTHEVPIEIEAPGATEQDRLTLSNEILQEISQQFPASDVDLGGIADQLEILAPRVKGMADAEAYSAEFLIAALTIRVTYTTEHSLAV